MKPCLLLACALALQGLAVDVPLLIDFPERSQAQQWPVTIGVPFPQCLVQTTDNFTVSDESGAVPCQLSIVARWPDGSVRWAWADFVAERDHQYRLVDGKPPGDAVQLQLTRDGATLTVDTGKAVYSFRDGAGCFDSITVAGQPILHDAGDAFYVVDSQGRRSVLRGDKFQIEHAGTRRAVVEVAGEYRTEDGQRAAAGVVYFHFYAGLPQVRIAHKMIVTENTNELWFRDLGLQLPIVTNGQPPVASFNLDPSDITGTVSTRLTEPTVMCQQTFPHFADTAAKAVVSGALNTEVPVCGNWADLSLGGGGLAAQVPGFAATFPKAFRLEPAALIVKLWAAESGRELDFRCATLMRDYFGHDWIPADHEIVQHENNAQGTARTHDIWLYPHPGPLTPTLSRSFGAVAEAVVAVPSPQWTCAGGTFGPIHPYDPEHFAAVESAIEDYFDRGVRFGELVFPRNGYLLYGAYPYSCQPWELRDGRWYPTLHRLGRNLEYNLQRHVWIAAARSGKRRYFDYAKRYTRFLHDLNWCNWDIGDKRTKGRFYEAYWHSPILWDGDKTHLAWASSMDVIAFVYDYLMTGELHSRDMVRDWKAALAAEHNYDAAATAKAFDRSDAIIRMIGSAYEFDGDENWYDYGHRVLEALLDPTTTYGLTDQWLYNKIGDRFSSFFYYWVSTRDDLALMPLRKMAQFDYHHGELAFMSRSSAMAYAYAVMARENGPQWAANLGSLLINFVATSRSHAEMNIDVAHLDQSYTGPWGNLTISGSGPIFYGLPVAMQAVQASGQAPRSLPLAIKHLPTQRTYLLLRPSTAAPVTLDLAVHNVGDRDFQPVIRDQAGAALPYTVLDSFSHRVGKPSGAPGTRLDDSPYYQRAENFEFRRLLVKHETTEPLALELGDEVAWKLLDGNFEQVQQVAPDGLVLLADHRYFFPVPAPTDEVRLFQHRPIRIFAPDGSEVALTPAEDGLQRFPVAGRFGIWSLQTSKDKYATYGDDVHSFVRFANIPMVVALDDAARLFPIDATRFPSTEMPRPRPLPEPNPQFLSGRIGDSALIINRFLEVDLAADELAALRREGTIEFWLRPHWSATDFDMDQSTQRLQLAKFGPIELGWMLDNPNAGRTAYYNAAKLVGRLGPLGQTRCDVYFVAGRWYHIAFCWRLDGRQSRVELFVNGRHRGFAHYRDFLPNNAEVGQLPEQSGTLRIGSAHAYGHGATGEQFDELRVSRGMRYEDDFAPATVPFKADAETILLLHFDGNLEAWRPATAAELKLLPGTRLD